VSINLFRSLTYYFDKNRQENGVPELTFVTGGEVGCYPSYMAGSEKRLIVRNETVMKELRPILLVENDPVQAKAVKHAFKALEVRCPCVHFTDGNDALAHLRHQNGEKPWLILLSLDISGMAGSEFLGAVKSDKVLKTIPVVLLTASSLQDDIAQSFELGAAGYIVKTSEYEGLLETIKTIAQYWNLCQRPVI
jgi:CheY-like chemotaxis protein